MKHLLAILVATTAISTVGITATLAADPAVVADPVMSNDWDFTAELGAGPTSLGFNYLDSDESTDGYAVRGLISGEYNFTPVLGAQGDLLLRFSSYEENGEEANFTSFDGALHGFYREPDRFLVGGIVQVGQDKATYDDYEGPSNTRTLLGAEGQAYLGQFTFYGQAGMQNWSIEDSEHLNGWFATGETRYFLTPDLKIEAHAGISTLTADLAPGYSADLQTVNLGAGIEYKFADMPFSVFGKYDWSQTTVDYPGPSTSPSVDTQRALVGIKFNLGEDTLQDRDRNGVSLKPVEIDNNLLVGGFGGPPT